MLVGTLLNSLQTSGSTGKPKGVVHTTAGYLLGVALTHKYVFDIHPDDRYACMADVGWITGHSYVPRVTPVSPFLIDHFHISWQLHHLWPTGKWYHYYSIRIDPCLPYTIAVLGSGRETQADAVLFCAHGNSPFASSRCAVRRTARLELFEDHRYGRRAYQSRGLELVQRDRRTASMCDRGYVLANRDREHYHHTVPWCD